MGCGVRRGKRNIEAVGIVVAVDCFPTCAIFCSVALNIEVNMRKWRNSALHGSIVQ